MKLQLVGSLVCLLPLLAGCVESQDQFLKEGLELTSELTDILEETPDKVARTQGNKAKEEERQKARLQVAKLAARARALKHRVVAAPKISDRTAYGYYMQHKQKNEAAWRRLATAANNFEAKELMAYYMREVGRVFDTTDERRYFMPCPAFANDYVLHSTKIRRFAVNNKLEF